MNVKLALKYTKKKRETLPDQQNNSFIAAYFLTRRME